jgi:hypothetical protein
MSDNGFGFSSFGNDHLKDPNPEIPNGPGARKSKWFRKLAVQADPKRRFHRVPTVDTRIGQFAQTVIAKQYARDNVRPDAVPGESPRV